MQSIHSYAQMHVSTTFIIFCRVYICINILGATQQKKRSVHLLKARLLRIPAAFNSSAQHLAFI